MRVAHLVQQHQRLLELGKPALEHLFKEGGRANRAAQEREPRAHITASQQFQARLSLRHKRSRLELFMG